MIGKTIRYEMLKNDLREGVVLDKVLTQYSHSGFNNSWVAITKYLVNENGKIRLVKPSEIFEVLTK